MCESGLLLMVICVCCYLCCMLWDR